MKALWVMSRSMKHQDNIRHLTDRYACCGMAIWHRPFQSKTPALGLGLFDDQTGWTINRQIFVEEQPDHYGFGDKATRLTGWDAFIALISGKMPK